MKLPDQEMWGINQCPIEYINGHRVKVMADDFRHCLNCWGTNLSMPTDCPGYGMSPYQQHRVWLGKLEYVNGEWTDLISKWDGHWFGLHGV